jgi:hypothetical protein
MKDCLICFDFKCTFDEVGMVEGISPILSWTHQILYEHSMHIILLSAERIGPFSSTPSTLDISPRLYQVPATRLLPSNVPTPNSGLKQYECGCMKPLLCAKQSSTGI